MTEQTTTTENVYTIDARGKKLGRVATEAASVLMGKNKPTYMRNKTGAYAVVIDNVHELDIPEKKKVGKIYRRYSGYPGGLKDDRMEEVIENKGTTEVLRRAISGMLPKNKLQAPMLAQLILND